MKFLKFIKADKLIPAKLMKKLEGVGKEENTKMYFDKKKLEDIKKVDILDRNFDFKNDKLSLSNANKNIERLSYYMDLNYLMGAEGRFDKVLKTLDEMSDYVVKKGNDIVDSTLKDDFQQNFNILRKRMGEIENSGKLKPIEKEELHNLVNTKFKEGYYIFRPQLRPKE